MPTGTKQKNREMRHQDADEQAAAPRRGERPAAPKSGKSPAPQEQAQEEQGPTVTRELMETGGVERPEHARRDPSDRRTAKPKANLRRTSETAPLRTAMDTISECFTYCLENGHTEKEHLTCMLDAWDGLNATSALVARGSPHADAFRQACAEAVKACEESCEGFEGDETMTACADVCREAYEHLTA